MRSVILIPIIFTAIVFGFFMGNKTECPEDLSAALKGCNIIAKTVSDELTDCRWEKEQCEIRLDEQTNINRKIFRTLRGN